jgi:hypothetical protein
MPSAPSDSSSPQIELLRAAYAAFNARDIDAAVPLMTPDVAWPRAFKGGFVRGPDEVRAYWTEQWSEINPKVEPLAFHPEDDGRILVEVHQVVRDMAGTILADERVGHCFTIENGLIRSMEVCSLPSANGLNEAEARHDNRKCLTMRRAMCQSSREAPSTCVSRT